MTRAEKLLRHIDKNGRGIEIGPSHAPVAPKAAGYNVQIADHMDKNGLIEKYRNHRVDVAAIEEVDFVWKGGSLLDLIGCEGKFDWIIASHVIEHVPDFVAFLRDCERLLTDDGVLSLAVPDKRFCFDRFRPISGLARVVDCHFERQRLFHTVGTVSEYYLNVISQGGRIAWEEGFVGGIEFVHSFSETRRALDTAMKGEIYDDLHAWVFVPSSFRLMVHDLGMLGLVSLRELDFAPTEGCEFMTTLSKAGHGADLSRLDLLQAIEREVRAT